MDIAITWDPQQPRGDWSIADGDLALGNPLESAIYVSLFTDGLAPEQPTSLDIATGVAPPSGPTGSAQADRRGWWGDAYAADDLTIGSRLWQLSRMVKAGDAKALAEIEAVAAAALQWLISDGVAKSVTVTAQWSMRNRTAIEFLVTVTMPSVANAQTFRYSWAWEGLT